METAILGEVVAWNVSGETSFPALVAALLASEFPSALARQMLPRHAFARACKRLTDERIIRKLDESGATITFQFTTERKDGDQLKYDFETKLVLTKRTGEIACAVEALKVRAQHELDRCMRTRRAADVTRLIQRMFVGNADLYPVREQGGAYFVPKSGIDFVNRVEGFITRVGGRLKRFPVAAGTQRAAEAVKAAIGEGLAITLAEYRKTINEFTSDTRESTMLAMVTKLQDVRNKVDSYNLYLGDLRGKLVTEIQWLTDLTHKRAKELVPAAVTA